MTITSNNGWGDGQQRVDVTASRALGVIYYNNTGRSIEINVGCLTSSGAMLSLVTEGRTLRGSSDNVAGSTVSITATIRNNQSYMVNTGGVSLQSWIEMR